MKKLSLVVEPEGTVILFGSSMDSSLSSLMSTSSGFEDFLPKKEAEGRWLAEVEPAGKFLLSLTFFPLPGSSTILVFLRILSESSNRGRSSEKV